MPKYYLGILCLLLANCVTHPGWTTTLKNGRKITSREFPALNDNTGYYRCQNQEGEAVVFHETQVASIVVHGKD